MPRVLAFGPFRLDLRTYVLEKDGVMVPLSPKLVQVLACLAEGRGELVSRDLLLDRFWPDVTVSDNTLTRAIADIRHALDDAAGTPAYIQTLARRGYRFVAPVAEEPAPPDRSQPGTVAVSSAVAGLEPFVAWERGRATLESLSVTALPAAAEAFSRAVAGAPHYAPAHAGLANAYIFRYEATRVDNVPDVAALTAAVAAATRAIELDPTLGEGWAALGHALGGAGRVEESRAALRQAVALEPRNWRHHYRIAACTWGEERLRAVERAEALLPGFPATQTLAAMVLIARQSLEFAVAAAARGAAAQAARSDQTSYPASGLLWMRGMTAAASGNHAAALDDFLAEEATSRSASTVYARECLVLALEAQGFTHLVRGDRRRRRSAVPGGRGRVSGPRPGHARPGHRRRATPPTASTASRAPARRWPRVGKHGECALLLAAAHGWAGRADEGLAVAEQALAATAPDATGWSLPADPLFAPLRASAGFGRLAARLGARAS